MLHLVLGGLLLLFNAGSTVFNQMAIRADGGKMAWSPAISASTTEAFKLVVALVFPVRALATASKDKSGKSSVNMPTDFSFCVKYAVPGLLYALCNVLNYTAVEYLGSTNYQLLNNVKIITTAAVYRAALKRRLKIYQWLALILLFFAMCTLGLGGGSDGGGAAGMGSSGGVAQATKLSSTLRHAAAAGQSLKQTHGSQQFLKKASKRKLLHEVAHGAEGPDAGSTSNIFAGTIVMLVVSVLSACAGVYNEILVKGTSASVWWQNVLLYTFTLLICLLSNFVFDARAGALNGQESNGSGEVGHGLFDGFTASLWICILMKAFYGQVVSLVFKYANNILKVYASSLSVIASALMCYLFIGTPLEPVHFVAGSLIVLAIVFFYSKEEFLFMEDASFCRSGKGAGGGGSDRSAPAQREESSKA